MLTLALILTSVLARGEEQKISTYDQRAPVVAELTRLLEVGGVPDAVPAWSTVQLRLREVAERSEARSMHGEWRLWRRTAPERIDQLAKDFVRQLPTQDLSAPLNSRATEAMVRAYLVAAANEGELSSNGLMVRLTMPPLLALEIAAFKVNGVQPGEKVMLAALMLATVGTMVSQEDSNRYAQIWPSGPGAPDKVARRLIDRFWRRVERELIARGREPPTFTYAPDKVARACSAILIAASPRETFRP